MIGGKFMENVHRNPDQTWIYDYDANTWTHIDCETPDTYPYTEGEYLLIKMNKKQAIFAGAWCFDLDSLKWFELAYPTVAPILQTDENEGFAYRRGRWNEEIGRMPGLSYIVRLNPDESYDSPYFLTSKLVNSEAATKWGPSLVSYEYNLTHYMNTFGKNLKVAFYDWDSSSYPKQAQSSLYLDENDIDPILEYMRWGNFNDKNISFYRPLVLLCNNILFGHGTKTGVTEYDTINNQLNYYRIITTEGPGDRLDGGIMAQLAIGVVMISGDNREDNSTWIFIADFVSIEEINDDTLKLLTLGDDKYQIDGEIKNVKLYDLLGNFVRDYEDNYIDLNGLATGTYFLQYFRNNKQRAIKLLKK
jgi:hypothetical protein